MAERRTNNEREVVINFSQASKDPTSSHSSKVPALPESDTGTTKPDPLSIPPPEIYKLSEKDDLLRFMIKEEVDLVLPLIEGGETGKITRNAFTEWVVMFFKHLSKIYGFIPCWSL
ncbi:hypothetical protein YC2023_119297 [Brassica napus]